MIFRNLGFDISYPVQGKALIPWIPVMSLVSICFYPVRL